VPQISDFPEDPPTGDTDLEIRMKHFTEIENFAFLGYILAHELKRRRLAKNQDNSRPDCSDAEFQTMIDRAKIPQG